MARPTLWSNALLIMTTLGTLATAPLGCSSVKQEDHVAIESAKLSGRYAPFPKFDNVWFDGAPTRTFKAARAGRIVSGVYAYDGQRLTLQSETAERYAYQLSTTAVSSTTSSTSAWHPGGIHTRDTAKDPGDTTDATGLDSLPETCQPTKATPAPTTEITAAPTREPPTDPAASSSLLTGEGTRILGCGVALLGVIMSANVASLDPDSTNETEDASGGEGPTTNEDPTNEGAQDPEEELDRTKSAEGKIPTRRVGAAPDEPKVAVSNPGTGEPSDFVKNSLVAILTTNDSLVGSGTIVGRRRVVTARHVVNVVPAADLRVVIAGPSIYDRNLKKIKISRIRLEDFNDIATIDVVEDFESFRVARITPAQARLLARPPDQDVTGPTVQIAGYGSRPTGFRTFGNMQFVRHESFQLCKAPCGKNSPQEWFKRGMRLEPLASGSASVGGDSGGPVARWYENQWWLQGVIAGGNSDVTHAVNAQQFRSFILGN